MSKGSGRRPGEGYEDNWEKIFGKKKKDQKESIETQKAIATADSLMSVFGFKRAEKK